MKIPTLIFLVTILFSCAITNRKVNTKLRNNMLKAVYYGRKGDRVTEANFYFNSPNILKQFDTVKSGFLDIIQPQLLFYTKGKEDTLIYNVSDECGLDMDSICCYGQSLYDFANGIEKRRMVFKIPLCIPDSIVEKYTHYEYRLFYSPSLTWDLEYTRIIDKGRLK